MAKERRVEEIKLLTLSVGVRISGDLSYKENEKRKTKKKKKNN